MRQDRGQKSQRCRQGQRLLVGVLVTVATGVWPCGAQARTSSNVHGCSRVHVHEERIVANALTSMARLVHNLQVSGGIDARFVWNNADSEFVGLEGVFLNLRKVFRDELGDRWILSLQADADENVEQIRPYQTFLQYKGPLGTWNIRAGHYIIPFGLLYDYDTERLLLRTIEDEALGMKLDSGVEVFGYQGEWDWALSVSEGIGRRWITDYDRTFLVTGRVSRGWAEGKVGLSMFVGQIKPAAEFPLGSSPTMQHKVALDVTYGRGQWIVRSELLGGVENGHGMGSGLLLADYALRDWAELNTTYALIRRSGVEHHMGLGVTVTLRKGWRVRFVDRLITVPASTRHQGEVQLYYDFTKQF